MFQCYPLNLFAYCDIKDKYLEKELCCPMSFIDCVQFFRFETLTGQVTFVINAHQSICLKKELIDSWRSRNLIPRISIII